MSSEAYDDLGGRRSGFRPEPDGRSCGVAHCSKPIKHRGYCSSHYMKLYRYGDPEWKPPNRRKKLAGQRFGLLTALEEVEPSQWKCLCDCGRYTVVRAWCLTSGGTSTCGHSRTHQRRSGAVTYSAVHRRLRADYGRARDHPCADCGDPAEHWSYSYEDPDQLVDDRMGPYSLDLAYYVARCGPCHRIFDRLHGRTPRPWGSCR